MKKIVFLVLGLLVASLIPLGNAQSVVMEQPAIAIPPLTPPEPPYGDVSKLTVIPREKRIELKPGEESEFNVTVKNKDETTLALEPHLALLPYGEYPIDESWVTITPEKAEIEAGETQEFSVKIFIPEDAELGFHSAQIAFTNETVSYPMGRPMAINALSLNIRIWKEPAVKILSNNYIHDRIEAGKSYTYEVKLENTGESEVPLNPKFGTEEMGRCMGMGCPVELDESWINISAPPSIAPGGKAMVSIEVSLPEDARGQYEGKIDLGIEDPSRQEYDQWWEVITLSIEAWQQPSTPYEREFTVYDGTGKVTVEITVTTYAYERFGPGKSERVGEPDFDLTLLNPDGAAVQTTPVKTVLKSRVSLGAWYSPPWEVDSQGIYNVDSTEHTVVYAVESPQPGRWEALIMPYNTTTFEYTITLE